MGNMDIRHEQIVIADSGGTSSPDRASVDSGKFANCITVANLKRRALACIFQILRIFTDRCKLKNLVVPTKCCRSFDDDMRSNPATGTNRNIRPDNTVGTDLDIIRNVRRGINNGSCMYQSSISFLAIKTAAEHASSPSTVAFASNRQMPRFSFSTSTSKNN